jgi:hypothetical protein
MPQPVCPHCGKVTDGEVQDKEIFLMVVCEECSTILGVLPKYFQKCTWKRQPQPEEAELEEAPAEVGLGRSERRLEDRKKRWD